MEVYLYRTMQGQLLLMPCKGHGEPTPVHSDISYAAAEAYAKGLGHKLVYQIGTPLKKLHK